MNTLGGPSGPAGRLSGSYRSRRSSTETSPLVVASWRHQCAVTQAAYFNCHASAASRRFPGAIEHLFGEHVRGGQNAVARQRFCPLQRFELVIFLGGFVGRAMVRGEKSPRATFSP